MSLTWIVVLSLLGFIVLILIFRAIYFFIFSKEKIVKNKLIAEEKNIEANYFLPMIRLFNLISFLNEKIKLNKISLLKHFLNDELVSIEKMPETIFGSYLLDVKKFVIENVNLLKNTPLINWNKQLNENIIFLNHKISELSNDSDFKSRVYKDKENLIQKFNKYVI